MRVNFSLSPEVVEELQKVSDETDIPMSRIVEKALGDYLAYLSDMQEVRAMRRADGADIRKPLIEGPKKITVRDGENAP